MSREVPYNETDKCDMCGRTGAYDFMGDLICASCFDKLDGENNLCKSCVVIKCPNFDKNLSVATCDKYISLKGVTHSENKLKRIFRVLWAHIRANAWCLVHLDYMIFTKKIKNRTVRIESGKGSILEGTWKTKKIFYNEET